MNDACSRCGSKRPCLAEPLYRKQVQEESREAGRLYPRLSPHAIVGDNLTPSRVSSHVMEDR
jgi:hypothetical protein